MTQVLTRVDELQSRFSPFFEANNTRTLNNALDEAAHENYSIFLQSNNGLTFEWEIKLFTYENLADFGGRAAKYSNSRHVTSSSTCYEIYAKSNPVDIYIGFI